MTTSAKPYQLGRRLVWGLVGVPMALALLRSEPEMGWTELAFLSPLPLPHPLQCGAGRSVGNRGERCAMFMIDGKVALFLLAILFGLPFLIGAVTGGVVGWLRGRLGDGIAWGIFGVIAGGFVGFVLSMMFQPTPSIVQLSFISGILIGAILFPVVFVKRPTDPTSKEPERQGTVEHN